MTLIDAFMTPCTLKEKTRQPDGEGGRVVEWADGGRFDAAIVLNSAANARVAESEGVYGEYTVTVGRGVELGFHDVFVRDSDGKAFRVKKANDPTPNVATFQFNQYQADGWSLT